MNKKILKSLACIVSGLGIVSTIPFISTSCNKQEHKPEPLPVECLKIETDADDNVVLKGFSDEFIQNENKGTGKYSSFVEIRVPSNVQVIADNAFYEISGFNIPSRFEQLIFEKDSKLTKMGQAAFFNAPFKYIDMSSCDLLSTFENFPKNPTFGRLANLLDFDFSENNPYFGIPKNIGNSKILVKKSSPTEDPVWTNDSLAVESLACGDINFPEQITSVKHYAFLRNYSIRSISFDSSSVTLDPESFQFNDYLTKITFKNLDDISNFTAANSALEGLPEGGTIYAKTQELANAILQKLLTTLQTKFNTWTAKAIGK